MLYCSFLDRDVSGYMDEYHQSRTSTWDQIGKMYAKSCLDAPAAVFYKLFNQLDLIRQQMDLAFHVVDLMAYVKCYKKLVWLDKRMVVPAISLAIWSLLVNVSFPRVDVRIC
ncbi:hypothetical protein MLD38_015227 [Melastoma candidum]|uniref:Uncharacterized protein n=1 Tax=Melastoma candidum TaxID=119954 RepID=A0ACB9RG04_9MYRT|nr:hypothetical protein MLD38_015227 [Melastoma candidum]